MASQETYLIDASIYIYRAWFSLPDTIRNKDEQPVNAVIGFFNFVRQFFRETQPQNIAFAFDGSLDSSYRNEIYPEYKKNRDPAPEELKRQITYCRELIRSLGILELVHNRYEADDLIGTLAAQAKANGQQVVIVSSDKDLTQLVKSDDIWWDYSRKKRFNDEDIKAYFGVAPSQMADKLALTGDRVDNIPGVPGIGDVTAIKLLNYFGTLKNLVNNVGQIHQLVGLKGAERIARLISENTQCLWMSRELTEIYCTIPLNNPSMEIGQANDEQFQALMKDLNLRDHHQRGLENYFNRA